MKIFYHEEIALILESSLMIIFFTFRVFLAKVLIKVLKLSNTV